MERISVHTGACDRARTARLGDPRFLIPGMDRENVGVTYQVVDGERRLRVTHDLRGVIIAQPERGYGIVSVRRADDGAEIERYYALDMAIDHAAEILGVAPTAIEVPPEAADMGL